MVRSADSRGDEQIVLRVKPRMGEFFPDWEGEQQVAVRRYRAIKGLIENADRRYQQTGQEC